MDPLMCAGKYRSKMTLYAGVLVDMTSKTWK